MMSCDHYNEISSRQIETLVIFKTTICNKIRKKLELIYPNWSHFFLLQSLSGHTTPIECVKFAHTEELVSTLKSLTFFVTHAECK